MASNNTPIKQAVFYMNGRLQVLRMQLESFTYNYQKSVSYIQESLTNAGIGDVEVTSNPFGRNNFEEYPFIRPGVDEFREINPASAFFVSKSIFYITSIGSLQVARINDNLQNVINSLKRALPNFNLTVSEDGVYLFSNNDYRGIAFINPVTGANISYANNTFSAANISYSILKAADLDRSIVLPERVTLPEEQNIEIPNEELKRIDSEENFYNKVIASINWNYVYCAVAGVCAMATIYYFRGSIFQAISGVFLGNVNPHNDVVEHDRILTETGEGPTATTFNLPSQLIRQESSSVQAQNGYSSHLLRGQRSSSVQAQNGYSSYPLRGRGSSSVQAQNEYSSLDFSSDQLISRSTTPGKKHEIIVLRRELDENSRTGHNHDQIGIQTISLYIEQVYLKEGKLFYTANNQPVSKQDCEAIYNQINSLSYSSDGSISFNGHKYSISQETLKSIRIFKQWYNTRSSASGEIDLSDQQTQAHTPFSPDMDLVDSDDEENSKEVEKTARKKLTFNLPGENSPLMLERTPAQKRKRRAVFNEDSMLSPIHGEESEEDSSVMQGVTFINSPETISRTPIARASTAKRRKSLTTSSATKAKQLSVEVRDTEVRDFVDEKFSDESYGSVTELTQELKEVCEEYFPEGTRSEKLFNALEAIYRRKTTLDMDGSNNNTFAKFFKQFKKTKRTAKAISNFKEKMGFPEDADISSITESEDYVEAYKKYIVLVIKIAMLSGFAAQVTGAQASEIPVGFLPEVMDLEAYENFMIAFNQNKTVNATFSAKPEETEGLESDYISNVYNHEENLPASSSSWFSLSSIMGVTKDLVCFSYSIALDSTIYKKSSLITKASTASANKVLCHYILDNVIYKELPTPERITDDAKNILTHTGCYAAGGYAAQLLPGYGSYAHHGATSACNALVSATENVVGAMSNLVNGAE